MLESEKSISTASSGSGSPPVGGFGLKLSILYHSLATSLFFLLISLIVPSVPLIKGVLPEELLLSSVYELSFSDQRVWNSPAP